MGKLSLWVLVVGWMILIAAASSVPGSKIPSVFWNQDISFHALMYAVLGFLFFRAFKKTCPGYGFITVLFITVIFGTLYGISDEWHQTFVAYRSASRKDVLIDGIGSLIGGILYRWPRLRL